ncbi:serine/threonine protein kinase, partial [Streptomyces sp. NPDC020667]
PAVPRPAGRPGGPRGAGRGGVRPGARTGSGARRPGPDRRLLRQRLTVFVVVTLLVALGIAVAQGCQGPAHSMGELPRVPVTSQGPAAAPGDVPSAPGPS